MCVVEISPRRRLGDVWFINGVILPEAHGFVPSLLFLLLLFMFRLLFCCCWWLSVRAVVTVVSVVDVTRTIVGVVVSVASTALLECLVGVVIQF